YRYLGDVARSDDRVTDLPSALFSALPRHARKLRTRVMDGGRPAQAERVGEHQLRLAGEQELAEGRSVVDAGAVGAGGVDGPHLVVHAEQDQVHAGEVAFFEPAVTAAVVAADQDAALQLVAPDRVRGGEIAGLGRAGLDGDG